MQKRLYSNVIVTSMSYFASTQLPFIMKPWIAFDRFIDTLLWIINMGTSIHGKLKLYHLLRDKVAVLLDFSFRNRSSLRCVSIYNGFQSI